MPNKNTLYIIGAGASSEVNLPTGEKLKDEISSSLDIRFNDGYSQSSGDRVIAQALRLYVQSCDPPSKDINPHLHSCWRIRDAMPQAISIDNFINNHSGDEKIELCGKLAIVRSILSAEKDSHLYVDKSNSYNKMDFQFLEKTWYSSFLKLLTENCTVNNLPERLKSISLIIFNYDRCLEHYLYNALQNYYGIQPEDAGKLVNDINIYHPYGVVGNLPWQGKQGMEFGAEPHPQVLLQLAGQIKTFTESTDEKSSEIIAIRNHVSAADNIVFLGFAFHKLNLKLMATNSLIPDPLKVTNYFGSAFGISDSDYKFIREDLEEFTDRDAGEMEINNKLKCAAFFKEYWRSLSLN